MKYILAATACFIAATVVCAQIANLNDDPANRAGSSEKLASGLSLEESLRNLPASVYGTIGAAALALSIAFRRSEESRE